jgi:hypothetical protein
MPRNKQSDPIWEAARQRALRSLADMGDEEEAGIARAIAADPDSAELSDGQWARMRRVGRPPMPIPLRKVAISIRLSPDVVD